MMFVANREILPYMTYWGLSRRPFEGSVEEDMYVACRRHREALERMLYLVRDGHMGFGLLTGEIGCGKSLVARVLAREVSGDDCHAVYVSNSCDDFAELLREILNEASLASRGRSAPQRRRDGDDRYRLAREFRDMYELKYARMGRAMAIILDEAQQLSEECLVGLKSVTNFCSGGAGGMSIVLVGQPDLDASIRRLPQVDQRIGIRYHLLPLKEEEVGGYVADRLRLAGRVRGEVFSDEAMAVLREAAGGVPREINRICKLALDRAYALGLEQVSGEVAGSIAADLYRHRALAI